MPLRRFLPKHGHRPFFIFIGMMLFFRLPLNLMPWGFSFILLRLSDLSSARLFLSAVSTLIPSAASSSCFLTVELK